MNRIERRSRPRTLQACHTCRKKKIKCNGQQPVCESCFLRGHECAWPQDLIAGNYTPRRDPIITGPPPVEERLSVGTTRDNSTLSPAPDHGRSNLFAKTGPPAPSASVLPPPHLLQKLLAIFWTRHHQVELCGFLHRSTFELNVREPYNTFLVYSIISLSFLYVSDQEIRDEYGFQSAAAASEYYAGLARNLSSQVFDIPSVLNIQANLVLGLRELVAWRCVKSWAYIGLALRMAQFLRMDHEYNQRHSARDREIQRRTFWACMVVDRLLAYSSSRPQNLPLRSCSLYLPCVDATFALGENVEGPLQTDVYEPSSSISKLGIMSFYITTIMIWGKMTAQFFHDARKVAKRKPTDPLSSFFQCEKEVEEWGMSIPAGLKWSVENYLAFRSLGQGQMFVNLHFLLKHSLCVAHQEYLPQCDVPSSSASELDNVDFAGTPFDYRYERIVSVCLQNAQDITDLARFLSNGDQTDRNMLQSMFVGGAIMTAASVFLWTQYAEEKGVHGSPGFREANDNFKFLTATLYQWRFEWRVTHAWTESLILLESLYKCVYTMLSGDENLDLIGETDAYTPGEAWATTRSGTGEGDQSFQLSAGDGLPVPSTICQRLYYKIRILSVISLEDSQSKKRSVEAFIQRLQQNIWFDSVLKGPPWDINEAIIGSGHTEFQFT